MNIPKFLMGGHAIFTMTDQERSIRYTYKLDAPKGREDAMVRYVSFLTGPNNSNDYWYIGLMTDKEFRWTKKSRVKPTTISFRYFKALHKYLFIDKKPLPSHIEIRHEGKCGRCGRKLTVPESIDSGFGPMCIGLI